MPDDLSDRLDAWGEAERSAMREETPVIPASLESAVVRARGEGAPVVAARLTMARWAPLAAALLLAAVAGLVLTRPLTSAPTPGGERVAAQAPMREFTLIGLMRANQSYTTEELVLPDSDVVAWTSRTPALSQ